MLARSCLPGRGATTASSCVGANKTIISCYVTFIVLFMGPAIDSSKDRFDRRLAQLYFIGREGSSSGEGGAFEDLLDRVFGGLGICRWAVFDRGHCSSLGIYLSVGGGW